MHDISKLPELAQIFDVTIDELLGEKSELLENAANEIVSKKNLSELADSLYHRSGILAIDEIIPFVPRETLRQIADKEYYNNGFRNFESLAPFLNRDYLNDLARKATQKNGIKAISPITPFLSKKIFP